MLKRLKKAILRNLQQLARKQEMKKTQEVTPTKPSKASVVARNAEKTQEDKPAACSKASPEAGNVEKTQQDAPAKPSKQAWKQ